MWLLLNDFDAAAVKEGEVYEINHRIGVKVGAATPMRPAAVAFKPMRYENSKMVESSVGYPDYVGAVKMLAGSKSAFYLYLNVLVITCYRST